MRNFAPITNPFGYTRRDGSSIESAALRRAAIPDAGFTPVVTEGGQPAVAEQPAPVYPTMPDAQRLRLLNYASMMCGGNLPITGVGATFLGDDVDGQNKYVPLFKNTLGRVIAVKIACEFGPATGGFNLSFSQELSNQNLVDRLSASGRVITDNILLPSEAVLYVNTADTAISVAGAIIRVLLLDPVSVFGEEILP